MATSHPMCMLKSCLDGGLPLGECFDTNARLPECASDARHGRGPCGRACPGPRLL